MTTTGPLSTVPPSRASRDVFARLDAVIASAERTLGVDVDALTFEEFERVMDDMAAARRRLGYVRIAADLKKLGR